MGELEPLQLNTTHSPPGIAGEAEVCSQAGGGGVMQMRAPQARAGPLHSHQAAVAGIHLPLHFSDHDLSHNSSDTASPAASTARTVNNHPPQ